MLAAAAAPLRAQTDPAYWQVIAPDSHVRASDPELRAAIRDGIRRSDTLRRLLERLQRSDVIVYLDFDPLLRYGYDGRMRFMSRTENARYLKVGLRVQARRERLIAMLAHELQHAVEVADASEVIDAVSLARLFARIGSSNQSHEKFETNGAVRAARKVNEELRGGQTPVGVIAERPDGR
jgi:hypothetical protein